MRDAEDQQEDEQRKRDDECERGTDEDGKRLRALALVGDLPQVRGLLHRGDQRVADDAVAS